ncbi:hypothetical protein [Methylobacterium fujisawaense]|uniref:hypothetical protein n=1 Tax=Methylobacterium fujisawaense TaxID=107400 RepID=UPI00313D6DBB
MSTRRATATQAEIARAIRALEAAGHKHPRITYTAEGVTIEPGPPPRHHPDAPVEDDEPERVYDM